MWNSIAHKWGILFVLSLALAIIIIDTTLLNVSLASIIRDLHADIQSMQWVITAYALMLAAFTITGGRLGDLFGRKRMFVAGAAIFACGSFLASISNTVGMMIIGEAIIEGVGAALMMPATSSLLLSHYKGRDRAIAFGVWGGIAAAASAIGPILGGYLTSHYSWRWGFRINLFVALLLVVGSSLIKESRDTEERRELDFMGIVLSSLGLLSIVFGVIESSQYGWFLAKETLVVGSTAFTFPGNVSVTIPAFLIGVEFLLLFILWEWKREREHRTPLVSLHLFQNQQFRSGIITTGILSLGQAGLIFSLPVFYQAVRGMDAFHTGLGLLPLSICVLIAAPLSAFLTKKFYPKHIIMVGLACNVASYWVLAGLLNVDATAWRLAPGLALYGIGMGFVMAQINNITLSAVSVQEAGEASGINNTIRQVGSAFGSAILGAVLLSTMTTQVVAKIEQLPGLETTDREALTQSIVHQTSAIEFGGRPQLGSGVTNQIRAEIVEATREATTTGNQHTLLYASIFSLLGFVAASRLPKTKYVERNISAANPTQGH